MPKFEFDIDVDKKEYAYSLLNPAELKLLESEETRWMGPETIRSVLSNNVMKSDDINTLAASIVLYIDTRINYSIFMINNEIFTREDLFETYPLKEFGRHPEDLMEQQEFGVFPYNTDMYKQSIEFERFDISLIDDEKNEYVQRRVGSNVPFVKTKDLIHYLYKNAALKRVTKPVESVPFRVVKTKLFIARQEWGDFVFMHKFARSISTTLSIEGGAGHAMKAIAYFFNSVINSMPMICDAQSEAGGSGRAFARVNPSFAGSPDHLVSEGDPIAYVSDKRGGAAQRAESACARGQTPTPAKRGEAPLQGGPSTSGSNSSQSDAKNGAETFDIGDLTFSNEDLQILGNCADCTDAPAA